MRWRGAVCVGLVSLACGAFPATTVAAGSKAVATFDPPVTEAGFKLHGSHGYSIGVVAYAEDGHKGTITFTARRKHESVYYTARAIVTADAIRADLGSIGKVDVVRHPSGHKKTIHPRCFGGKQTYETATYEGVIEFNGENGYTRARATRVAGLPAWLLFVGPHLPCGSGYGESIGSGEPGARLHGVSFAHRRSLTFQVNKNRAGAKTVFKASLGERRRGIRIDRDLSGVAPPGAFRFAPNLRTATLKPPAPFSGSASLSRSRNSFSPIWKGDLKLDFPGRSVSLAGGAVHVSLAHARFTTSNTPNVTVGF